MNQEVSSTGNMSDIGGSEEGRTWKDELKVLLTLSFPVMAAQISQTGMSWIDMVMSGRVSDKDMAAVATASSVWHPVMLFGIGVLMAISPIVAHLHGGRKMKRVKGQIRQGLLLSWGLSILLMIVLSFTREIMTFGGLKLDSQLVDMSVQYMNAMIWGVPAVLMFVVLRGLNEGMSMTKPAMVIGALGLAFNIPINYMFIFGKFGAPALGGPGCGVATAIVFWIMFLLMLGYVVLSKEHKKWKTFSLTIIPDWKKMSNILKIGVPIGLGLFFEVSSFAIVAILVAAELPESLAVYADSTPLGVKAVASHNVALNVSALLFMIPLSIATAVTVRVGRNLGAGSSDGAKLTTKVALILAFLVSIVSGLATWIFREQIARLCTIDEQVVMMASSLMFFAAIYQVSDFVQVVGTGVLRGYKDTRAIMLITFFSYWGVSISIGYILARTDWIFAPMGVSGFWIGFIFGLTTAAILIGLRIRSIQKKYKLAY